MDAFPAAFTAVMTMVIYILAVALITALAYSRRDIILYIIACPAQLMFAYYFYLTYRTPLSLVVSLGCGALGFYSLYLAAENIYQQSRRKE